MSSRAVTIQLPTNLVLALHDLAIERKSSVDKIVEELLGAHIVVEKGSTVKHEVADQRLVFALQKLLFRDMAEATDWDDLDRRLRKHGYFLKVAWGGLALHTETNGRWLCNASDLGFSYVTFQRRFGPGKPKSPNGD